MIGPDAPPSIGPNDSPPAKNSIRIPSDSSTLRRLSTKFMAEKNKISAAAPKPKRLLMTADTVGGVWTYALELAHALEEHGIEIALATMGAPLNRGQRKQIKTLPHVEIFESSFKLEWMNDPWRDVARAGNWLLEIESRVQPDLIHLNNFAHGDLPWSAPKIMVGHSCVLSWWKAVHGCQVPAFWTRYSV